MFAQCSGVPARVQGSGFRVQDVAQACFDGIAELGGLNPEP